MKIYRSMEEVPEKYLEDLNKMRNPDGQPVTDEQKLQALNNLTIFAEDLMDRWFGTGLYANKPGYDAEAFRHKEIERHAKEDRMTPQEFYDEAYADFMNRFGKSNIKRFGVEATEEKARAWATSSMNRAIETRELWYKIQAESKERENAKKAKSSRTRKKAKAEQV